MNVRGKEERSHPSPPALSGVFRRRRRKNTGMSWDNHSTSSSSRLRVIYFHLLNVTLKMGWKRIRFFVTEDGVYYYGFNWLKGSITDAAVTRNIFGMMKEMLLSMNNALNQRDSIDTPRKQLLICNKIFEMQSISYYGTIRTIKCF